MVVQSQLVGESDSNDEKFMYMTVRTGHENLIYYSLENYIYIYIERERESECVRDKSNSVGEIRNGKNF
jgi:hypothetical protein